MTDKISKYKNKIKKLAIERGFPTCKPTYSFDGTYHYFCFSLIDSIGARTDVSARSEESIKEACKGARDIILKLRTGKEMQMCGLSVDIRDTVAEAKALGISEKKLAKMIAKEWVKKDGDQ